MAGDIRINVVRRVEAWLATRGHKENVGGNPWHASQGKGELSLVISASRKFARGNMFYTRVL